MNSQIVREFTVAHSGELSNYPTKLNKSSVDFLIKMVTDELVELKESKTVYDQVDAMVDAIYYIYDCAVRNGINLDPIFSIVHEANMKKLLLKKAPKVRHNEKVEKPEGWCAPDEEIMKEMINQSIHGAF